MSTVASRRKRRPTQLEICPAPVLHQPTHSSLGSLCSLWSKIPAFFIPPVKKTYLTSLGLTADLVNKIKGFVPEKNPFPEAVKIWLFLLKWAYVDAVPRKWESPGGIHFTTENTKSTET